MTDIVQDGQMIGIVQDGQFQPLMPPDLGGPARLTTIQMQEAVSPESREIDLSEYEGRAVMVEGRGSGGAWIYSAKIVDVAGLLLTEVVKRVFAAQHK